MHRGSRKPFQSRHKLLQMKQTLQFSKKILLVSFLIIFSFRSNAQVDYTVGTGTAGNGNTGYPCPLQDYWEGSRMQFLYLASDLAAAGMTPGNITAIKYNVVNLNGAGVIEEFRMSITGTTTTTLSTTSWVPISNVVVGPINYQPTTGINVFNFSTPFFWNGTDNVLVEICGGDPNNSTYNAYTWNPTIYYQTVAYNANHTYRTDDLGNLCSTSTTTQSGTATLRPNITFTLAPAIGCSGPPTAGTTTGPSAVCSGIPFNLSLTGFTSGTGITLQWQSSPTGLSMWSNIPGATSATYTATQTAATDYQVIVTCINGGLNATSIPIQVGINPFYNCYCTSGATSTADGELFNVSIGSINNSSTCPGLVPSYANYSSTVAPAQVLQGATVPISFIAGSCGGSYDGFIKVFIDFNKNGSFTDAGEEAFVSNQFTYTPAPGTQVNGTVTIPVTASTGLTGMRVVMMETTSAASVLPCGGYGYGETEDYLIDILAAVGCTGTPIPGTAAGPANACAGLPFNLSLTGYTQASSITFQWQQSPANLNMWQSISGATNAVYTVASQTTSTDYRVLVTCVNSSGSALSNVVAVSQNSPTVCYCLPTSAGGSGSLINEVIFGSISNNTSTTNPTASPFYSSFSQTTNLMAGSSVPLTITIDPPGTYTGAIVSVWIDYDQSGTFDVGEWQQVGTNIPGGIPTTISVNIPINATSGTTGMRIRSRGASNPNGAGDACVNMGSGETEDYMVTIVVPTGCTGQPTAGTATGPANVCAGTSFNLLLTGQTIAQGVNIQWESSPSGQNNWVAISGATNGSHTVANQTAATDYRAIVTCTNSSQSNTSNTVIVAQNAANQCYCNSSFSNVNFEYITNVTAAGINNSSAGNAGGPVNYTSLVGLVTTAVPFNLSVSIFPDANEYIYAFIDWNQNGILNDAGEVYTVVSNTSLSGPHVISITPPITAVVGNTRMRVMLDYDNSIPDPCRSATYGEAEDYTLNVGAPLAIRLSEISATNVGHKNRVDWKTTAELDDDYFELERGEDGRQFSKLNTVKANGSGSEYSFWDETPLDGTSYYRLKLFDRSGSFVYSDVVNATLKRGRGPALEAYPNPVETVLKITVNGTIGNNATISLIDVAGRTIKTIQVKAAETIVNMDDLAQGVYFIKYTNEIHQQTIKINKQ